MKWVTDMNIRKDVVGYEGRYTVTETGMVWSSKTKRWLKPRMHTGGYLRVNLYTGESPKNPKDFYIHRLVGEAFLQKEEGQDEVNHIDGNKTNNNVSNLEWVTDKQNKRHAIETGLWKNPKGATHHWSTISDTTVINILHCKGESPRKVAKAFGVSRMYVVLVWDGKVRKELTNQAYCEGN